MRDAYCFSIGDSFVKVVILAGGFGTRLSEETTVRPKPMVEVGNEPILWHIMKSYSHHGLNEFVICLGYKGWMIKDYFYNYFLRHSDVTMDLASNTMEVHHAQAEPWKVTLVDTGVSTLTGGRLKRVKEYIGDDAFCFTYGDGVCDVDIADTIRFHKEHGKLATLTAIQPPGRFGSLEIRDNAHISSFKEKVAGDIGWVNGGYFVLEPQVIDYIPGDGATMPWEAEPLERIAREGELVAYKHPGFWQCMDHLSDKVLLEKLWDEGAPWKKWV
jgi:glucose-1-phosphate cytidylyltransferase